MLGLNLKSLLWALFMFSAFFPLLLNDVPLHTHGILVTTSICFVSWKQSKLSNYECTVVSSE